ncbi:leucine-rich repeat-containing protein 46 [Acridotheres tristis]
MDPQATPAMAELILCGAPEEPSPGVTLSNSLIMTRIRSTGPLPTSSIRLDRENISSIGKLQRLGDIHSLYLQQNRIEKMENLESFPNLRYSSSCSQGFISMGALGWGRESNSSLWDLLNIPVLSRFLCLAGNRIQKVENLQALPHLRALDLSHNLIQVLDTEELPRSLQILDLTGNECTQHDGYRDLVLAALPNLLQLDFQPIHEHKAEEEAGGGSCSSSSEEEEDEELHPEQTTPFTFDRGDRMGTGHAALSAGSATSPGIPVPPWQISSWSCAGELWERRAMLLELAEDRAGDSDTPEWCQLRPRGGTQPPRAQLPPLVASSGSQRAPGTIQPPGKALEKETGAKGAGNGKLSQISRSSSQE